MTGVHGFRKTNGHLQLRGRGGGDVAGREVCLTHSPHHTPRTRTMSTSRAPIIPDGTKFHYFAMLSTRYKDEDNQVLGANAVIPVIINVNCPRDPELCTTNLHRLIEFSV